LALALACSSVVLTAAGGALGATVTKNSLSSGIPGFPTAPGGLGVFEAETPLPPPDAVREVGSYDVTVAPTLISEAPFAGMWRAYAVTDVRYHTDNGVAYPMELQLAADAWAGEFLADVPQKLTWLLRNADALIAGEADKQKAAAAVQIVVWQTLRNPQHNPPLAPRADLVTPTTDTAVNELAAKFTALMDAGYTTPPAPVGVTVTSTSGCTATLTVTGAPHSALTLTADNNAVVSPSNIILDATGTATATVTAPSGVTVTVTASAVTGSTLVRADGDHAFDEHTTEDNLSKAPEELIFLAGAQVASAAAPVACVPPPVPTPVGNPSGKLKVIKTGPGSALAGQVVTYRLKVTNSGSVPASSVLLRDIMPSGMSLAARPASSTVTKGVVTWKVGVLAPGASKTVTVRIKLDRSASGRRCNTGRASASNAATVSSRACTVIRAVAGAGRVPAVTG
jgi:uncharacterized repeat protein (TIGR01451 family)